MPLRLYQRGKSKIWHYRGTVVAGHRLRGSCGTTDKSKASRKVSQIEEREWKRDTYGPEATLTFPQAAAHYIAAGKSPRFLKPIVKYLGNILVKDITPGVVQMMAMKLYGHCSGASRNRLAIIPTQAVINHNADSGLCQRIRVKRFKTETREKQYATLEWILEFGKVAPPYLGAYALLMFLTGARPSEALECDIDLTGATALLHESKIGHERRAHLPPMLVAAIANLKEIPGRPLFFYRDIEAVRRPWDRVIKLAKIQRMTPHCCRHGFITGLLHRGVDVKTAAWLADMTPEVLLNTYAHAIKDRKLTNVLTDTLLTQPANDPDLSVGKREAI